MNTNSYRDTEFVVSNNRPLLDFRKQLPKTDKIKFSGFETVLFNKQLTHLIHCPVIAKGSYKIPSSVQSIGIEAFSQCKDITEVIIPESLIKIGCLAFENCISLTSILIPESVKEIGFRAFSNCICLKSIYIKTNSVFILNEVSDVFYNINKKECILYVLKGTKKEYQLASKWKDFQYIVEIDE